MKENGGIVMLDIHVLRTDYGVSYGSVTLKSLQNDNVPDLDLLVREAIQNSSDASLTETGPSYAVNFSTGLFTPSLLNEQLTRIKDTLNARYPEERATYLEIRDTGTTGLTGPIEKENIEKDDHGNFFKLIFDTGKKQTQTNAGGNWGFGKSVYYRVGMGIVIFYSQIETTEGKQSRMIITLVEDENKKDEFGNDDTILGKIETRSAGKAWWGIQQGEDLLPLTSYESILSILNIFGIAPFNDDETGTSIIIPYIDTKKLLEGIIPVEADIREDVKELYTQSYTSSLADYLRLSIQKWYAPKIHNRKLQEYGITKWLRVSVDNQSIRKQDMIPFFRLTQELYTTALAKCFDIDYSNSEFPNIKLLKINIMNYFESGTTAGYLAVARIKKADLYQDESLLSPYDYIGKFEADGGSNEPIVMYARDPGMVIDYAITGDWVKGISYPENTEDFVFGFFVPDTRKIIKRNLAVPQFAGMPLGSYLRECEASDHMSWYDPVKMQIVQRIQRNCTRLIEEDNNKSKMENVDGTASKLAGRLGKSLMPKVGYGGKSPSGGRGGGGGGTKIYNVSFDITSMENCGDETVMEYTISTTLGKKKAAIYILIASEAGNVNAQSWEDEIGTPFPVAIVQNSILAFKTAITDETEMDLCCDEEELSSENELIKVRLEEEGQSGVLTRISFETHEDNPIIKGRVRFKSSDRKCQFLLGIE